jgi:3-oxoacyl-[acyl-carrier protein] reductase
MNDPDFINRTVLVTGGSRGIGRECCINLAKAGANIAINYNSRSEDALETAKAVEEAGAKAITVQANVTSEESVQAMVHKIENELGPVEMLVNNAGIFEYVTPETTTLDHWKRTIDVNLTGTYIVTWAVKDQMIKQKYGRIVNMSSISALRSRPYGIAYAASKAGIIAFTQSASAALIEHNIRMNGVAPGLVKTEIIDDVDQATLDRINNETPMKRIGQPDDISEVVHFLLSEKSKFMMGQTLVASGGRVMLP